VSNVSRNDLLVDTDSVAHLSTLDWTDATDDSRMFGRLPARPPPPAAAPARRRWGEA